MAAENLQPSFRSSKSEQVLNNPEFTGLVNWYKEQLANFGEMTVEDAPLTDGNQWKAELTAQGEVDNVDGAFFTLRGQTVTRYNLDGKVGLRWTQPGVLAKETEIAVSADPNQEAVKVSGFVGIIKDKEGRMLLSLVQEPFAHTPKNVLARTPFQTSTAKFAQLIDGKRELDPQLFDLLASIVPGGNPRDIFSSGALDMFPLPYADANRIDATNIGFVMKIEDDGLAKELENGGKNRWATQQEVSALSKAGILNGHAAAAILASL